MLPGFLETERGNNLFVRDDSMVAWLMTGADRWLEVSWTPANYPALCVVSKKMTEGDLVDHINDNLEGWEIRKCNLEGVRHQDGIVTHCGDVFDGCNAD